MGPGPSDVPPRVLEALSRPTIGHLDPAFIRMMDEVKELLQYAFQTRNAMTMPVSAPGSAGMETCFVNLVEPGDKVIVCQNGVFGGRMKENVERCGGIAVMVSAELKEERIPFVFLGTCVNWIQNWPQLDLRGRILSIYEESDPIAGACSVPFSESTIRPEFEEIGLSIGGGHGAFYRPAAEWVDPVVEWVTKPGTSP